MSPGVAVAWRFAALGGLSAGLALSPLLPAAPPPLALLAAAAALLAAARPRAGGTGAAVWLALVAATVMLAGLAAGAARLGAIDAGALVAPEGERLALRGVVVTTPRPWGDRLRFVLDAGGRVVVESRASLDGVDAGRVVDVRGTARAPGDWERDAIAREGAEQLVAARSVEPTSATRGGLMGALDGIRRNAEAALERGTPPAPAALLRGFVLGQDDRIDEPVRDDFRRSGLAHMLAVSGQNVVLLALLATPFLALAGVPFHLRLLALGAVIAVYVPVAGAGPSIQRAGIMGMAGIVAGLAGRPRARWYALLLAAAATLGLNPRATGDVGWQLSFAAVAGLLVLAAPLVRLLAGERPSPGRRLLAEGGAMTVAATLATAPLSAHHFGTVSLTAVPANLLALPAVAPAMWLGMLAGALGQITAAPVEPLTALGGLCAGFIAWVARAFGGPAAQLEIPEPRLPAAIALTLGALFAARLACAALARRAALRSGLRLRRLVLGAGTAVAIALVAALALDGGNSPDKAERPPKLTVRFLDVGQGDSILLAPREGLPVLVDAGPPGGGVAERLEELGVDHLGAIAITHDQVDHAGGLGEVLARVRTGRILAARGAMPDVCAHGGCPLGRRLAAGDSLRSGRLRLDVLWPPAGVASAGDPNARSLVLRARLGSFAALLTGDAESEAAPVSPGAVDLLKVAHHGSADSGLPALLAGASPRLAVISVGNGNPYGHPAQETTAALAAADVPVVRTDVAGEVAIEVRGDGWTVE